MLRAESVDESCSNQSPRQQGRTCDGCFGCTGRNCGHPKHGKLSAHTHAVSQEWFWIFASRRRGGRARDDISWCICILDKILVYLNSITKLNVLPCSTKCLTCHLCHLRNVIPEESIIVYGRTLYIHNNPNGYAL